jgi:AcrR family transcriptional regulator
MPTTTAPRTARERARAELAAEIKDAARRQLAEVGPAALSLRAVARELGMVSSAVYRYFPSRDDLLTALIIDAYESIGEAGERAVVGRRGDDYAGRWLAVCRAVRAWALANPHEYGLIYGSPVPGYRAPQDTIGPASRITAVMVDIVSDAEAAGRTAVEDVVPLPRRVRADLASARRRHLPSLPERVLERSLMAWTLLFGAVSFELFGHLHDVIEDYEAFFDHEMASTPKLLGLWS